MATKRTTTTKQPKKGGKLTIQPVGGPWPLKKTTPKPKKTRAPRPAQPAPTQQPVAPPPPTQQPVQPPPVAPPTTNAPPPLLPTEPEEAVELPVVPEGTTSSAPAPPSPPPPSPAESAEADSVPVELREAAPEYDQQLMSRQLGIPALVWGTHRGLTAGLGTLTLLRSAVPASEVWLGKLLVDAVAEAITTGAGMAYVPRIVALAAAALGLALASGLLRTLANVCQQLLQERVAIRVQLLVMEHASQQPSIEFIVGNTSRGSEYAEEVRLNARR